MANLTQASIYAIVAVVGSTDEVEREFLINYSHYETKLWLTRTLVWCLLNDRALHIEAATSDDIKERKLFIPAPKEEMA